MSELATVPDAELMARHTSGDATAFGELVRRHRDRCWAVALRMMRDPEDAADAVQDAMVSAFRAAGAFRGDAQVSTWLHRIVVNACLDRLRRRRPTVALDAVDEQSWAVVADHSEATTAALTLSAALAQLPEDQRRAIVLVDLEGFSIQDAAEALGVAPGTVKSRCSRGRLRLAVSLGHLHPRNPAALRNVENLSAEGEEAQ